MSVSASAAGKPGKGELKHRGANAAASQGGSGPSAERPLSANLVEPNGRKGKDEHGKPSVRSSSHHSTAAARSSRHHLWAFVALTALSFLTRFMWIAHPDQVVFDEVHFGKFASYYLRGTYYFDVHPPLGKLMLAGTGYAAGYNGSYLFDKIGDEYKDHAAPFIALRAVPAAFGAALVPLVYGILQETGHSLPVCVLGAALTLLDNALVAQCRLILLDSFLVFFCIASCYAWIKFYKLRHAPFTARWFAWLALSGIALALTLSVKMVGLLSIATIAVGALKDMWRLADTRRGLTLADLNEHFLARLLFYVFIPAFIYVFWFWVHFAVLSKSGPGDAFMTTKFQSTLEGSKTKMDSRPLFYGANITIKAVDMNVFLHSHVDRYPLRYDDGRVSSQGQQVTGYPHYDTNNFWQVLPDDAGAGESGGSALFASGVRMVKHNERIRLRHCNTGGFLLTHDVASPLTSTNMELTVVPEAEANAARFNETVWKLALEDGGSDKNKEWRTVTQSFHLLNTVHSVAMRAHKSALPTWGFGQQEINGDKQLMDAANRWTADDIVLLPNATYGELALDVVSPVTSAKRELTPSFLAKVWELQSAMLRHNAGLTKSHPYQSGPESWPFLHRGISFWQSAAPKAAVTQNGTAAEGAEPKVEAAKPLEKKRAQIYLLGNPLVWVASGLSVLVYLAVIGVDLLCRRRDVRLIADARLRHLWNASGMFFVGWCLHYLPFYLMGRALFLHHYLPALIYAIMLAASLVDFALRGAGVPAAAQWAVVAAISAVALANFVYFSPLTYGFELTPAQIGSRKWISSWDFQFAPNVNAAV